MSHVAEARVVRNEVAMGRSTPAAADQPYLTIHEVLRASGCRAAGRKDAAERKDMAAAHSRWDTEGGAIKARE
jgi:hypothetical protein